MSRFSSIVTIIRGEGANGATKALGADSDAVILHATGESQAPVPWGAMRSFIAQARDQLGDARVERAIAPQRVLLSLALRGLEPSLSDSDSICHVGICPVDGASALGIGANVSSKFPSLTATDARRLQNGQLSGQITRNKLNRLHLQLAGTLEEHWQLSLYLCHTPRSQGGDCAVWLVDSAISQAVTF
jgi:hypothetical protein